MNNSMKNTTTRAKLIIPGKLPGLNDYITAERASRFKAAKMKSETQTYISWCIRKCLRGVTFKRPVVMAYHWIEKDRKRDKDNIAFAKKFIQDALVQCGVIHNDGWAEIEGFSDEFSVDKNNVRVEVLIWEYEKGEI